MTFYSVSIYSSNLAGEATSLSAVLVAEKVISESFTKGESTNAMWCSECKRIPYVASVSAMYHSFMVREAAVLELVRGQGFKWSKKRGFGRATPIVYLEKLVKEKTETWFQVELSEI